MEVKKGAKWQDMLNVSQIAQCSTSHCKWHQKDEEGLENTAGCVLEELQAKRSSRVKVTNLLHRYTQSLLKTPPSYKSRPSLKMSQGGINNKLKRFFPFLRVNTSPQHFTLILSPQVWQVIDTNVIVRAPCLVCSLSFTISWTNCFSSSGHPTLPPPIWTLL